MAWHKGQPFYCLRVRLSALWKCCSHAQCLLSFLCPFLWNFWTWAFQYSILWNGITVYVSAHVLRGIFTQCVWYLALLASFQWQWGDTQWQRCSWLWGNCVNSNVEALQFILIKWYTWQFFLAFTLNIQLKNTKRFSPIFNFPSYKLDHTTHRDYCEREKWTQKQSLPLHKVLWTWPQHKTNIASDTVLHSSFWIKIQKFTSAFLQISKPQPIDLYQFFPHCSYIYIIWGYL